MGKGFRLVDGKAQVIEEDEVPVKQEYVGLGDVVEKITTFTGIKSIVDSKAENGECTPCQERKKRLNNIKLYKK